MTITVAEVTPPPQLWDAIRERVAAPDPTHHSRGGGDWREIHPGVTMKQLSIDTTDGRQSFLLRFMPGASLPAHEHAADEECLVMEGAIAIGDLQLNAGDYHLAGKDLPHPAIASASGALLFIRGHVAA
jgi:anti-sigma factor ChrR (cupin superfamily)